MRAQKPVKVDPGPWLPLLEEYTLQALPVDNLLRGTLRPGLDPSSPEIRQALQGWRGEAYLHHEGDVTEVVLIHPREGEPAHRLWLHGLLFALTLLTTLAAGAMMQGLDPFATRVMELGTVTLPIPTRLRVGMLAAGIPFALPFLGVLTMHEMGHFIAARRHRIRTSLPYFIPFPPYLSIIGTLGAFIRLKGATVRRSSLFDVGAAGPIVSFFLSLPLLAVGLVLSEAVPGPAETATPFFVRFLGFRVWLGDGALVHLFAEVLGPVSPGVVPIHLHPLAVAGWLGLFVTTLNLLPLGQLDGGHILHAVFGEHQSTAARVFLLALIPMGFVWWGWWAWAVLVAFLHRGRLHHPGVAQPGPGVGSARTYLGWFLILVFFLTFVPVPIRV